MYFLCLVIFITFFSLAYFIGRIQYITHIQNKCQLTVYIISKASGESRLLVLNLGGVKSYKQIFNYVGGPCAPNTLRCWRVNCTTYKGTKRSNLGRLPATPSSGKTSCHSSWGQVPSLCRLSQALLCHLWFQRSRSDCSVTPSRYISMLAKYDAILLLPES